MVEKACPFKLGMSLGDVNKLTECITERCAVWDENQKVCSLNWKSVKIMKAKW